MDTAMIPSKDVDAEKRPAPGPLPADHAEEDNHHHNDEDLRANDDAATAHPERTMSNVDAPVVPPPALDDNADEFKPPGGRLRAWTQVLAAHLINTMTWGYAGTFGVYQLHYTEALRLPASQVSWIGSVQVFLTFAVCAPSGRLVDAGYAREAAAAGCFLAVLGTFMTSLATAYWQIFLAQGVCTGLGLGIAFMPALSVTSSYFRHNRAFALSVSTAGTSVGSVVFPATVQYLTPQVGFPWAVRCAAFIALVNSVAACLMLRPYLPPRKTGPLIEWTAFRELPYVLFALGSFLNFYAIYTGLFFINSFARNIIGFSTTDSVSLLLINNALGIPTRPFAGYLASSHFGPINTYTVATFFVGVGFFSWIGVTTRAGMYAFSVFFGIAISANQGVFVGALASLTKDPRKMGTRFGMIETLSSFATVAGPPTAGALIDRSGGSHRPAQIWAGVFMTAAASIFATSRIAAGGWKWKVKL
ncbi:major facilitator superfamily transporter [Purpureocillium lavendulum]|uniref:Major facilitator superfamily transporter n=1 Tax=Purpureocillium lavendulum TaxID=1247861 RepID=A0AB34FHF0_9HYPO|nr:major facilitator superfamily transporter [Purpureocillium lavendulum]